MNKNVITLDNFKLLVCIYTCAADDHLLDEFYGSLVIKALKQRPNTKLIEVRANEHIEQDDFSGGRLTVKSIENYNNLPRKTYFMVRYLTRELDFDYLLKIDVTTLTTVIRNKLLSGGEEVTQDKIIEYLCDPDFYQDYSGYVRLNAKRQGAENWAEKKGIDIDYQKIFDKSELPPFFSGKMWLISNEFATFIADNGAMTVNEFSKYFPAEDVMIGTLYQKFINHSSAKHVVVTLLCRFLDFFKR